MKQNWRKRWRYRVKNIKGILEGSGRGWSPVGAVGGPARLCLLRLLPTGAWLPSLPTPPRKKQWKEHNSLLFRKDTTQVNLRKSRGTHMMQIKHSPFLVYRVSSQTLRVAGAGFWAMSWLASLQLFNCPGIPSSSERRGVPPAFPVTIRNK